mgnify:CR=1 FL=1|jgi:hypothetical protein
MSPLVPLLSLLLIICGVLLLISCRPLLVSPPASTPALDITLTTIQTTRLDDAHTATSVAQPTAAVRVSQFARHTQTPTPSSASQPAALFISAPVCYPQPGRQALCFGLLTNGLPNPVEDVRISGGGLALNAAQRYLAPGQTTPFHAFVPAGETPSAWRTLSYKEGVAQVLDAALLDEQGAYTSQRVGYGYYEYRALLAGGAQDTAVRVVVTLFADDATVVGYRIHDVPRLAAGARVSISLHIIPQVAAAAYTAVATLSPLH